MPTRQMSLYKQNVMNAKGTKAHTKLRTAEYDISIIYFLI